MTLKNGAITLSLLPEQKERLEQIALEFGHTWGRLPNISKLMRAIADGDLQLSKKDEPPSLTRQPKKVPEWSRM